MKDYIEYLDFDAIAGGDKHFSNKNYELAQTAYNKALNLLEKYNGASMAVIEFVSTLITKIEQCNALIKNGE